jgi:hypothetical protein
LLSPPVPFGNTREPIYIPVKNQRLHLPQNPLFGFWGRLGGVMVQGR